MFQYQFIAMYSYVINGGDIYASKAQVVSHSPNYTKFIGSVLTQQTLSVYIFIYPIGRLCVIGGG